MAGQPIDLNQTPLCVLHANTPAQTLTKSISMLFLQLFMVWL